jgi:hypothetical protein
MFGAHDDEAGDAAVVSAVRMTGGRNGTSTDRRIQA